MFIQKSYKTGHTTLNLNINYPGYYALIAHMINFDFKKYIYDSSSD